MTSLPKVAEVTNFFIHPKERGPLGLLLMRQMIWEAMRNGIEFFIMGANQNNDKLISFYRQLAGNPIGETTEAGFAPVALVFAYTLRSNELTEAWREKLLAEYNRIQQERVAGRRFSTAA
jgi:hypothetical protein